MKRLQWCYYHCYRLLGVDRDLTLPTYELLKYASYSDETTIARSCILPTYVLFKKGYSDETTITKGHNLPNYVLL